MNEKQKQTDSLHLNVNQAHKIRTKGTKKPDRNVDISRYTYIHMYIYFSSAGGAVFGGGGFIKSAA